jgi:hypothetical protein
MLIEDFNVRIQPHLADHPLRLGASMVCNQMEMDTHTFLQMGVSSEVQQSGMDDDGSSEGDFILALPIAAFKVFRTT